MTITYEYEDALYVNLTNKCNCNCEFCLRHGRKEGSIYTEDSLWLEREPTREEALDSFLSRDVCSYREIVFCGYGEPTYRLDDILWLVDQLKERFGRRLPPVRINTNGHANLILGRDVVPELKGRIDTLSISLNAVTAAEYTALCHPAQGEAAYQAMLDFAREATRYVPHVVLTIVDKDKSSEEIETCRQIAAEGEAAYPLLHRLLRCCPALHPCNKRGCPSRRGMDSLFYCDFYAVSSSSSSASRSLSAEKQNRPAQS